MTDLIRSLLDQLRAAVAATSGIPYAEAEALLAEADEISEEIEQRLLIGAPDYPDEMVCPICEATWIGADKPCPACGAAGEAI